MTERKRSSTGIMMASQVNERFVLPTRRPRVEGSHRHHSEVSNYFERPPAQTTTTRYTVHQADAGTQAVTAALPVANVAPAPPPPPMAPLPTQAPPAPAPAPVIVEPEPEPEPEPRVVIAPEVIVSWGSWTRGELYEQAKELDIPGRSKMTKRMLLKALVAYVCG